MPARNISEAERKAVWRIYGYAPLDEAKMNRYKTAKMVCYAAALSFCIVCFLCLALLISGDASVRTRIVILVTAAISVMLSAIGRKYASKHNEMWGLKQVMERNPVTITEAFFGQPSPILSMPGKVEMPIVDSAGKHIENVSYIGEPENHKTGDSIYILHLTNFIWGFPQNKPVPVEKWEEALKDAETGMAN